MSETIEVERNLRRLGAMLQGSRPAEIIEALNAGSGSATDWFRFQLPVPVQLHALEDAANRTGIICTDFSDNYRLWERGTACLPVAAVSIRHAAGQLVAQATPTDGLMELGLISASDWIARPATGWQGRERPKRLPQPALTRTRSTVNAGQRRVDRLAAIQAAFGLPVQTLADVLQISRPGVYKWLDAANESPLRAGNRQRLAAVERLAKLWLGRTTVPLSSVAHEPLANGRTILDTLSAEHLDEAAVSLSFGELIDKLLGKAKTSSQLMAEAGFKRRPSFRSTPGDE